MHRRIAWLLLLLGVAMACAPSPQSSAAGAEPVVITPSPSGSTEHGNPAATATATATATSAGITLFVADTLADCQGEGPMKCMRIRTSQDQPWSLHYDRIDGFSYEPSYAYELRVEKVVVAQPSADASSFRYRLLQIVSKRKVEPATR